MKRDQVGARETVVAATRRAHDSHRWTPPEQGLELCRVCGLARTSPLAEEPCDAGKSIDDCRARFGRHAGRIDFRGFPSIPGQEAPHTP